MNDLLPIALFVGCLLATFGFLRVCERLRPATQRSDSTSSDAAPMRNEEAAP